MPRTLGIARQCKATCQGNLPTAFYGDEGLRGTKLLTGQFWLVLFEDRQVALNALLEDKGNAALVTLGDDLEATTQVVIESQREILAIGSHESISLSAGPG